MELPNLTQFFSSGKGLLVLKAPILLLMFLYILFLLIVLSRIKALNRTLQIEAARASSIMQILAVIQLLLTVALFVATIILR
jgi:hypothetical protein